MDKIQTAWDKVRGPDDAAYGAARGELKADLQERADSIRKTGSTNKELMGGNDEWTVFDRFEEEFKKLHQADVEASKHGDVPAEAEFVVKSAPFEVQSSSNPVIIKDNVFESDDKRGLVQPATDDVRIDEGNDEEGKESLVGKTRDELDGIAVECGAADSFEDSKERFSNMKDLRAAIEEARSK